MTDEARQPKTEVVPQRFEEDELRKLLQDMVGRKGLVGAARALSVNFRTLTAGVDSDKLSRRMREAREEAGLRVQLPSTILVGRRHRNNTFSAKITGGRLRAQKRECRDGFPTKCT